MADLLTAIQTLSTKLIPNSTGEKRRTYVARLADYSHRLLFAEVPQLSIAKVVDEASVPEPLSSDPGTALHQLLAATGHPSIPNPDGSVPAIDPQDVIADATPEQNRELALLGFFGQSAPNPVKGVDYSLFEQYYEQDAPDHWQPKAPYLDTGTWQAYLATKS